MRDEIKALKAAVLRHPDYVSGDDDLRTDGGVVKTAVMVLDRMVEDRRDPDPILDTPLTIDEMRKQFAAHEQVSGVVRLNFNRLIDGNLEQVLDTLSEKLTGTDILCDLDYEVVGSDDGDILVRVTGNPEMIFESAS